MSQLNALKAQLELQKKRLEELKQSKAGNLQNGKEPDQKSAHVSSVFPKLQANSAVGAKKQSVFTSAENEHDETTKKFPNQQGSDASHQTTKDVSSLVPDLEDFCKLDDLKDLTMTERDLIYMDNIDDVDKLSQKPFTFAFTSSQRKSAVQNLVDFVVGTDTRAGKGIAFEDLLRKKYCPSLLASSPEAMCEKIFLFNWLFDPLSEQYRCYLGLLKEKSEGLLFDPALKAARERLAKRQTEKREKKASELPSPSTGVQHTLSLGLSESIMQEHSSLLSAFGTGHKLNPPTKRPQDMGGVASHYSQYADMKQGSQPIPQALPPPPPPPPPPPISLTSLTPSLPGYHHSVYDYQRSQPPPNLLHPSFVPPPPLPPSELVSRLPKPPLPTFTHPSRVGFVPQSEGLHTQSNRKQMLCQEDIEENRDFEEASHGISKNPHSEDYERESHLGIGAGAPSVFYASFTNPNLTPIANSENPADRNASAIAAMEQVFQALATHRGGIRTEEEKQREKRESEESNEYRDWLFENARRSGELDEDGSTFDPPPPPPPKRAPGAPLDASNAGFRLLMKMGWKEGSAIGKQEDARIAPIEAKQRNKNMGIGAGKEASSNSNKVGGTAAAPPVDAFEAYRQRMQDAYKKRPNPLGNPRKAYY